MDTHQESNTGQAPSKQGFIDRIFGRFRKDGAYPYWLKSVLPVLSDGSVYDETLKRYFILCYVTGFACLVLNALAKWVTGDPEIGFGDSVLLFIAYAYGFFYMWLLRKEMFEAQKFYREWVHPTLLCKFIPPEKKSERRTIRGLISTNGKVIFPLNLKIWLFRHLSLYVAMIYIISSNFGYEYQAHVYDALYFIILVYIASIFNISIVDFYFTWETFDPPVFKAMVFVHLIGAVYLIYKINFVWGQ